MQDLGIKKKSGMDKKTTAQLKCGSCGVKVIHRDMKIRRSDPTWQECMEVAMSPAQKEVFIAIDEWWKKYGFSPTIRDIAYVRGKMGLGNTKKIVDRLVLLGVIKKVDGTGRTIRPAWVNYKNLKELE
jgi:hypothetical protein